MEGIMKLFFCFALCVFFSSCPGTEKKPGDDFVRQVRGAAAAERELANEIDGFGSLSFLTKIDIAAPQEGSVKKLFFREGDKVRRGETVVLLENPQISLAVGRAENARTQAEAARNLAWSRLLDGEFQAEARLLAIEKGEAELIQARRVWEEEERKLQDQEALFEAGGLSEEGIKNARFTLESGAEEIALMEKELEIRRIGCRDRDLAAAGMEVPGDGEERFRALISLLTASLKAELAAAGANLEAAEKELESTRIASAEMEVKSPGTGIVGARYFEEGERVKREDKILTLMDTASLYAIFPVKERDALRLEKGMTARVEMDGTGQTREGVVDLVYPQADSQSFTFLVRVLLKNQGDETAGLKPGMFARVSVTLGPPRPVLVLPESSLMNKGDREGKVFVINGNTLSERTVGLGLSLGKDREIVSGISAGEVVVLKPEGDLREGTHVYAAD
jgi:multidrug efflux pump subunit AcrA (membrane-fusion protein)